MWEMWLELAHQENLQLIHCSGIWEMKFHLFPTNTQEDMCLVVRLLQFSSILRKTQEHCQLNVMSRT